MTWLSHEVEFINHAFRQANSFVFKFSFQLLEFALLSDVF